MALTVLLADIGGTSTRIARAGLDGQPYDIRVEANDAHASLEELFKAYLEATGGERPVAGVFAVAGPVEGDKVRLTNRDWAFSRPEMAAALGLSDLKVLNDFVALAHGVPALGVADLVPVGAGQAVPGAPILVCGPGTGLGTAALIPQGDGALEVLPSEGGHVRFGAVQADEARILAHLVREFGGSVSVERVLSGSGLVRLHAILNGATLTSQEIIRAGLTASGPEQETCFLFLRILGRVLGDYALLFDARGGVFIPGGVAAALAPLFAESLFRAAFEDHDPHRARLVGMPTQVVVHPTPGLVGTATLGRRLLARMN
ncbi:glucokinase [Azorhizobium oxalatiphilum]|uniref:Glucokinase n=1 Tax=Azorhizobium oxalatiphilum TaxID=980631 RepID=A0A917FEN4_9HYPH|nr:glucokinase [Azorhizobium oxalatiphilum]GGF76366.1 glucokinase [Azorhizobium oxalatiphilum]